MIHYSTHSSGHSVPWPARPPSHILAPPRYSQAGFHTNSACFSRSCSWGGLSYALIRCFLCNHFIKCLCNLCEKNNKTLRIRSSGCLLLAEPSILQLLGFGVSWAALEPELEGHLGASTGRLWREEGRRGTNREGRAEVRRERKALLGQLVLKRV